ncbi:MAG: hypothetical protein GX316_06985 [Firmicutes bacterium]|nr:hypothetical protein [Bacillota bacterium]
MKSQLGFSVFVVVLLLLTVGAVSCAGQKTGDIFQAGSFNDASIEQRLLNEALIWQNGYANEAELIQIGLDHEGTTAQFGQRNTSHIRQRGCESIAITTQLGAANQTDVTQIGAWHRWSFPLNPYGTAFYHKIFIMQLGRDNQAETLQMHGLNEAILYQSGVSNEVSSTQILRTKINPKENHIYAYQIGTANQARFLQMGTLNKAVLLQKGVSNQTDVRQWGMGHSVFVGQRGIENSVDVTQRGSANESRITQHGNQNQANIVQNSGSHAVGWTCLANSK